LLYHLERYYDEDEDDCDYEFLYTGVDTAQVILNKYVFVDAAKHKAKCLFEIPRPELYRY
jgi:hypothetical protein